MCHPTQREVSLAPTIKLALKSDSLSLAARMNLPNALTVGRIAITPLIAVLPFAPATTPRLVAFILFVFAAVSDYADGVLARSRKQETNLGRLLDPLADKLLLVGTFVPMWALMQSANGNFSSSSFGSSR